VPTATPRGGKRDRGAGLARAGGHDQQGLALPAVEGVADCLDGPHLVGPLDDRAVDVAAGQRLPRLPT